MRFRGRTLFSLALIAIAAYAILSARSWPFKAALFPLATGIPLVLFAMAQLLLDLTGRAETARGPAVDMEFSADVPPSVARQRTAMIFAWISGFILLVLLFGFPIAVPLFMILYLTLQSRAGFLMSFALTAAAWGFFYGLFQWLLRIPFDEGLVQTWLGL